MKQKVSIALSSFLVALLLLFVSHIVFGTLYDYFPSWEKLPPAPSKPVAIEHIESRNIIVRGEDNKPDRCFLEANDCWAQTSELQLRELFNYYSDRTFGDCDFSKAYFRIWLMFHQDIIDCKVKVETSFDAGDSTVVALDSEGNVWVHYWEWSAYTQVGMYFVYFPILVLLALLMVIVMIRIRIYAIIQRNRARKNKTVSEEEKG